MRGRRQRSARRCHRHLVASQFAVQPDLAHNQVYRRVEKVRYPRYPGQLFVILSKLSFGKRVRPGSGRLCHAFLAWTGVGSGRGSRAGSLKHLFNWMDDQSCLLKRPKEFLRANEVVVSSDVARRRIGPYISRGFETNSCQEQARHPLGIVGH